MKDIKETEEAITEDNDPVEEEVTPIEDPDDRGSGQDEATPVEPEVPKETPAFLTVGELCKLLDKFDSHREVYLYSDEGGNNKRAFSAKMFCGIALISTQR